MDSSARQRLPSCPTSGTGSALYWRRAVNKAELVEALEARLGSKKAATEALDAVVDTIMRAVVAWREGRDQRLRHRSRRPLAQRPDRTQPAHRREGEDQEDVGAAVQGRHGVQGLRRGPAQPAAAKAAVAGIRGCRRAAAATKATAKPTTTEGHAGDEDGHRKRPTGHEGRRAKKAAREDARPRRRTATKAPAKKAARARRRRRRRRRRSRRARRPPAKKADRRRQEGADRPQDGVAEGDRAKKAATASRPATEPTTATSPAPAAHAVPAGRRRPRTASGLRSTCGRPRVGGRRCVAHDRHPHRPRRHAAARATIQVRGAKNFVSKAMVAALLGDEPEPCCATCRRSATSPSSPACSSCTACRSPTTRATASCPRPERTSSARTWPTSTRTPAPAASRSCSAARCCTGSARRSSPTSAAAGSATGRSTTTSTCCASSAPSSTSARGHPHHARRTACTGTKLELPYPSVGATEQVLLTAVRAEGVTELRNAAIEPEIMDLIAVLQKMGAII